eukprot:6428905-Alexandrium_andersonii.AAC.1
MDGALPKRCSAGRWGVGEGRIARCQTAGHGKGLGGFSPTKLRVACGTCDAEAVAGFRGSAALGLALMPVSYTHLTLPTICSV